MGTIRALAILSLFLLPAAAIAAEELSPGLSIEPIGRDAYLVTHAYPWPSNSLVAAMLDGRLLLIDTPCTPEATEALLRWTRARLGPREIVAGTTHFHVDRLGGNAALVRRGIPIYGSTLTPKAIAERGALSLRGLASMIADPAIRAYYESFRYVAPTRLFDPSSGLSLDFGGEEARVEYPGVGHSVDNLVVYLPGKRLIFGGCMILSAETASVGNVADGDIAQWIGSLAQIGTEDCDILVPGHGRPGRPSLVAHSMEVIEKALGQ
jgi:metallo-beta-lactamase class B